MLALRRFKFSLLAQARNSRKHILYYRNRYLGKKALILCNGPSLNDVDLDRLSGFFCFGLNKINLIFESTAFRPSCIVAVNDLVIAQNRDFYEQTDIPVFLDGIASRNLVYRPNHIHLCCYERGFSKRAETYVSQGGTVTFVAMQLAYYMGFSEVALVGCDHYFPQSGRPHETLWAEASDANHFSPNYFSNQLWHAPDLEMNEKYYLLAKQEFEKSGRHLYNASTTTRLEIFPRKQLTEFLNE